MATAIIADDERLMREQLRSRLGEVWPELQVLAEARNGEEAVAAVDQHRPDLAFLDIRMPGMTGIEAARAIGDACHVVFITAYNEYAVGSVEQGAVDYVLKPAEKERLEHGGPPEETPWDTAERSGGLADSPGREIGLGRRCIDRKLPSMDPGERWPAAANDSSPTSFSSHPMKSTRECRPKGSKRR